MNPADALIRDLYTIHIESDWRAVRERGLLRVAQHLGVEAAAWLTTSGGTAGAYTETLRSGISKSALAACVFAPGECSALLPASGRSSLSAFRHVHLSSGLSSLFMLRYPGKSLPAQAAVLLGHLAEAAELAQRLYIQRDEWLNSMGRSNRGAAALVDAGGGIHAGSERFLALLLPDPGPKNRLPFALPVAMREDGGSFVHGELHLRVLRADGLYVMHARKPLPLDALSPREQQIARALGAGKTFKSVAQQCGIAVSTVANHATRIYRKLGIYRREELIEMLHSPSGAASVSRPPRKARGH